MTNHYDSEDWNKSFMRSIHQMHFLIEKHLEQRLAENDNISFAQFLVLMPIRCHSQISQSEIAEATNLTEATVSRHVGSLLEDGLLTRVEDPENRRKYMLELTPKGTKAITAAKDILQQSLDQLFAEVTLKDRNMIMSIFDRITGQLLAMQDAQD